MPGNTTARGYGSHHQKQRARWARIVQAGAATCTRCDRPIHPHQPWDLDHSDDRTTYLGAAHAKCNRAAGGRKARARDRLKARTLLIRSRNW